MAKHYAEFGFVFIVEGKRSSNPNASTLIAYMYKHHGSLATNITFDLDEHDQMIEDLGDPIAKINWHGDTVVKILNKTEYVSLNDGIKASIESTFRDYLTEHVGE